MDPVDALSKPNILEHLPIFAILVVIIGSTLAVIVKKLLTAYHAAKEFVNQAIDERMPNAMEAALDKKAPAIFERVVAERLAKHEEVEEEKLQNALAALKNQYDADRVARDAKLGEGLTSIMDKLSGVDNRLQVVQLRTEAHDARLRAVEEVIQPLKITPRKRRKR